MGWTCTRDRYASSLAAVIDLEGLTPQQIVATSGGRGRAREDVVYLALRATDGRVDAYVALVERHNDGDVCVKLVCEAEGPYHYGASKAVIKALTAPRTEWARAWRLSCLAGCRVEPRGNGWEAPVI